MSGAVGERGCNFYKEQGRVRGQRRAAIHRSLSPETGSNGSQKTREN